MKPNQAKKVLIVEDDDDLRKIIARALSAFNYIIFEAEDGDRALQVIHQDEPHLVILDLLLPKTDGFKVLENVRHSANTTIANIPVIVLSNLWTDKDILRIQSLKIEEYYVKATANLQDVYAKVQEVLAK